MIQSFLILSRFLTMLIMPRVFHPRVMNSDIRWVSEDVI